MRFTNSPYGDDTPTLLGGVGGGQPVRWLYSEFGHFLNVWGKNNNVNVTFNLKSKDDIDSKLDALRSYVRNGLLAKDDLCELEERLRTYSNLASGGNGSHTHSAIVSEAHAKGKKYTAYKDGKLVEKVGRGERKHVTSAQLKALAEARKKAHTDEACTKRRKSIQARRDAKTLGL